MPSLIIKESDNKVKVEAETKAAKEITRASKRISGRD
jgi:hypothetical protein